MSSRSSWCRVAVFVCLTVLPICGSASAQLIPVKTMPLAEGDQFGFLPTANLGMGGVTLAIPDTLLDPFSNPAKGARVRHGYFFMSPSFYAFSQKAGSGRTLPIGALLRSGSTFGSLSIAVQELSPPTPSDDFVTNPVAFDERAVAGSTFAPTGTANPRSHSNRYASAMLGRVLPRYGLSVAASAFWSGLGGVDGVDALYVNSQSVEQSGEALDVRFGVLKEWGRNRTLEAVLLHTRYSATHDVNYLDLFWDPGTRQVHQQGRVEHNADRVRTSGLHLVYVQPLADSGWRIGGVLTANRTFQPAAAPFDIISAPHDPGRSAAFNVGMGVSKAQGPMTIGVDAIYEPIWLHTRTDVAENRFRFSNSILRAGVSRDFALASASGSSLRLQLGMQLRSVRYWRDQYDVLDSPRFDLQDSWKEWANTMGASLRLPEVEIHYRFRSTTGTGRPGSTVNNGGGFFVVDGPGFFPSPSNPSTLTGVRMTTQQFSVSVPVR
jgi:hypothetical protein